MRWRRRRRTAWPGRRGSVGCGGVRGKSVSLVVSVIRYYVPFPQQQHPAISVYNILKQLVGSIRHITKRIIIK